MCSFFPIINAQHYFCMLKYTRNQFNTKVHLTEKTRLPKRTVSGVMDNMPYSVRE